MDMRVEFPGGKKVSAIYKGFTVLTDQPESVGGDGQALSPFDLFLVSLGTCAGYYVQTFCQERDINMEDLKITLKTERDAKKKMLGKIIVEIHLPSDFPKKYRKAIVAAANSCAVKKHIFDPPLFEITAELVDEKKE